MTKLIKRGIDLAGAVVGLVILAPLLLVIAVGVLLINGRPVIFRQTRPGLNGKPFAFFKFRTMTDKRDTYGTLLPDAERLTRLGRFLRSTSLDEFPQFVNVLKGDMSLVGPRPLLMAYLSRYTARQARRHEVKPGITGWVQVNGRNSLTWEQKFEMDVWYVEHQSLWLDIKILLLTLLRVVRRDGISQSGHATMPEFFGGGQN